MGSIVIGIDGSDTARAAMLKAADIAKTNGSRVHLVCAQPRGKLAALAADPLGASALASSIATLESELSEAARRSVDAAANEMRALGIEVETYVVDDDPASAIIAVAEDQKADLIVVGNRGMRGARRFVLGSVPNDVAHHAPCDVMIVRTT